MGTGFLQEDNGNSSSMRLVLVLGALTIYLCVFISTLAIFYMLIQKIAVDPVGENILLYLLGLFPAILTIIIAGKAYQKTKEQSIEITKQEDAPK